MIVTLVRYHLCLVLVLPSDTSDLSRYSLYTAITTTDLKDFYLVLVMWGCLPSFMPSELSKFINLPILFSLSSHSFGGCAQEQIADQLMGGHCHSMIIDTSFLSLIQINNISFKHGLRRCCITLFWSHRIISRSVGQIMALPRSTSFWTNQTLKKPWDAFTSINSSPQSNMKLSS